MALQYKHLAKSNKETTVPSIVTVKNNHMSCLLPLVERNVYVLEHVHDLTFHNEEMHKQPVAQLIITKLHTYHVIAT